MNILGENIEFVHNNCLLFSFPTKQIDLTLFSQISKYFFWCHSLLKWFFQNRHDIESTWCSPQQLVHLKVCGHSFPFLVLRHRGLILLLALQHQPNLQWFSNLWDPLHFTHFDLWILQEKVEWPHFQQFLHWGIPGFALAILTVVIDLSTLKHWFIRPLSLASLWAFHISIHTIVISDLGDTLITQGLDARIILSKIWFCLIISLTSLNERHSWELQLPWG